MGERNDGSLPVINGNIDATAAGYNDYLISWINWAGCFFGINYTTSHGMGGGGQHGGYMRLGFDAKRSSSAYSRTDNKVYGTYLGTMFIIKY